MGADLGGGMGSHMPMGASYGSEGALPASYGGHADTSDFDVLDGDDDVFGFGGGSGGGDDGASGRGLDRRRSAGHASLSQ